MVPFSFSECDGNIVMRNVGMRTGRYCSPGLIDDDMVDDDKLTERLV